MFESSLNSFSSHPSLILHLTPTVKNPYKSQGGAKEWAVLFRTENLKWNPKAISTSSPASSALQLSRDDFLRPTSPTAGMNSSTSMMRAKNSSSGYDEGNEHLQLAEMYHVSMENDSTREAVWSLEDSFALAIGVVRDNRQFELNRGRQRQEQEMELSMKGRKSSSQLLMSTGTTGVEMLVGRHVRELEEAEKSWEETLKSLWIQQQSEFKDLLKELSSASEADISHKPDTIPITSSKQQHAAVSNTSSSPSKSPPPQSSPSPAPTTTHGKILKSAAMMKALIANRTEASTEMVKNAAKKLLILGDSFPTPFSFGQPSIMSPSSTTLNQSDQPSQSISPLPSANATLKETISLYTGQGQQRTLYRINIVCSELIPALCGGQCCGSSELAKRERTSKRLFSHSLSALVVPTFVESVTPDVDTASATALLTANSNSSVKAMITSSKWLEELSNQAQQSQDMHFGTLESQLKRELDSADGQCFPSNKGGDVIVTRHSNLLDVHVVFHLFVSNKDSKFNSFVLIQQQQQQLTLPFVMNRLLGEYKQRYINNTARIVEHSDHVSTL